MREVPAVRIDIGALLRKGFELYKAHLGLLIAVNAVGAILAAVTASILAGPLAAGIAGILLALIDKREPSPAIGDVFKGFDVFLPAFLLTTGLTALSLLVGWLMPYIAGFVMLVIATLTMFALFHIIDRNLDVWPAIVASYNAVKANFWPLLAIVVLATLASAAGVLACGIGLLVTMPYYGCVLAVTYREACAAAPAAATKSDTQATGETGQAM